MRIAYVTAEATRAEDGTFQPGSHTWKRASEPARMLSGNGHQAVVTDRFGQDPKTGLIYPMVGDWGDDDPGDRDFSELLGWVRRYVSEDGWGMPRCGTDLTHRTAWVWTSRDLDNQSFGPYPNHHILWCSDCKRVLFAYADDNDPPRKTS